MLLICGIIFIIGSLVMKIWPPKKINSFYGYRTTLSMSSEEAWHLAQQHSTKALAFYGLLMAVIGIFTGNYIFTDEDDALMIVLELIILLPLFTVLIIYSTHRYLKRKLDID